MEVTLLSSFLDLPDGEWLFKCLTDSFVSKNKDVESFLKTKAVQSSKLSTSATYLDSALQCVKTIFSLSSGKTVFLECEPCEKLICFYERCGFSLLGNISFSKDKKELVQMFRFV